MNSIPGYLAVEFLCILFFSINITNYLVDGPFDFKIYGPTNAFTSRSIEFLIASDNTPIEEILIISK
jgi:hypothetical protein